MLMGEQLGFEVMEMNASDVRSKKMVEVHAYFFHTHPSFILPLLYSYYHLIHTHSPF